MRDPDVPEDESGLTKAMAEPENKILPTEELVEWWSTTNNDAINDLADRPRQLECGEGGGA
jgi:hypothetical protein